VAADADTGATVSSPATTDTTAAAADPDRHRRRHRAVRENPTDIAFSFLNGDEGEVLALTFL